MTQSYNLMEFHRICGTFPADYVGLCSVLGLISKSQVIRFKQDVEVKNTHQNDIIVTLEESLPLSRDDHIKVGHKNHGTM